MLIGIKVSTCLIVQNIWWVVYVKSQYSSELILTESLVKQQRFDIIKSSTDFLSTKTENFLNHDLIGSMCKTHARNKFIYFN